MIKSIIFNFIKTIVYFMKISKLKKFIHDKIIFYIGVNQVNENRKIYKNVKNIQQIELKIFSQNGEDGIIDYLLYQLGLIPNHVNFVEIGVGDYRESNTRFLYNCFYPKGTIVDCIENLKLKIRPYANLWRGDLRICEEKINSINITDVINKYCNYEIDFFSIDIDSVDYWIIKKLKNKISKVFVAEYNPVFGPDLKITVPNLHGFDRTKYHYSNLCYGMSLRALIDLMEKKGYYFIGTNLQKINAFFISRDFKKEDYFKKILIDNLENYTDSNIRDSRDRNYNLNFLSGKSKLREIENCSVINLENNKEILVKIKDLI